MEFSPFVSDYYTFYFASCETYYEGGKSGDPFIGSLFCINNTTVNIHKVEKCHSGVIPTI